jgi:predicted DCC family thiol-disulfide oxidoreductase YuxK
MNRADFRKNREQASLIYDGSCPICSGTVKWIKENEIENSFMLLPCQTKETADRFPGIERAACMKAMHLVLPDGSVLVGEQALPEILSRLKRYRFAALLFRLPGSRTISRIAYRWFADRRYKIAAILAHFTGGKEKQKK